MSSLKDHRELPWDGKGEIVVWIVLLAISAVCIHNGLRLYKRVAE